MHFALSVTVRAVGFGELTEEQGSFFLEAAERRGEHVGKFKRELVRKNIA